MAPARIPWQTRFWRYVTPNGDECWEWRGAHDRRGYGRLTSGGRNGFVFFAHRASYMLHVGPIPDGLQVCHRCDNPPCVNPAHLFVGTARDNAADMVRKGRAVHPVGEAHPHARLSDDDVRAIRERAANGVSRALIAREFGIWDTYVSNIVLGRRRVEAGGPIRSAA